MSAAPEFNAAALEALSEARLVGRALRASALSTAQLSRALGITPDAVRRARRAPTTLSLKARLTLAAVIGYKPAAAPIARELRRRTLDALRKSNGPIPSDRSATSATAHPETTR